MLPVDPAERHRVVAARFSALVVGVRDWSAPTPVTGWDARSVVIHLTTWLPAFVHAGSPYPWTSRFDAATAPTEAWQEQCVEVQRLLDDPERAQSPFRHDRAPASTLAETVDRFYTADVFMHSWDLARATGQDASLDEDFAEELLRGMEPIEALLRSSGQYGPPHPVAPDARATERLVAFIGRDPHWQP